MNWNSIYNRVTDSAKHNLDQVQIIKARPLGLDTNHLALFSAPPLKPIFFLKKEAFKP